MRFSLRLNNDLPVDDYRRLARTAESAGFDQLWISHDLFLRSSPVLLAAVAEVTDRLEIGTGILNPYTLDPAEIAMTAATLDELSGGRFNLGLAAGAADFLHWVGREQRSPLTAVRETVDVLRLLLAGERAPVGGRFLNWTEEAYLRFPVEREIPIYVGATGPKMLELAGEIADGVLPLLFPPEHFFTVEPLITKGIARRSPELPALDLAACVWVSVDEDRGRARRALAEKVAYYGAALSPLILERLGLEQADFEPVRRALHQERDLDRACDSISDEMLAIGVVGSPGEIVERLRPLVEAGVRHLSFGPPLGPEPLAALELLGREVLPVFREGAGS